MRIQTKVMLRKQDLPTRQAWQEAIHAHGFDLELPADFDPARFSGMLHCRLEGIDAAFEYALAPLERGGYNEVELRDLGTRDHVASFAVRPSTGVEKLGAANLAAAVLCAVADGLLRETGDFIEAKDAIRHAQKTLDMTHTMQQVAGYVKKKGGPPDSQRKVNDWVSDLQAATGITLPLIPHRLTPEQKSQIPPPPPKVRMAAPPGSLAALWYEIEDLNRARGVDVDDKFARQSNEEELRYFERRIGHLLPEDLREFFLICSGFEDPWPCAGREPIFVDLTFVLGGIQFNTLAPAADDARGPHTAIRGSDLITLESIGSLFQIKKEGPCLCYDRTKDGAGRIVEVDLAHGTYRVVAPSIRAWLEGGLGRLKTVAESKEAAGE